MADTNLDALLEKSAGTDVQVLLNAKEQTKRQSLENPTPANLAAFERASKMLENAVDTVNSKKLFPNWSAALAYLNDDCNRKVGKTKMFEDIRKGLLKKQTDESFKVRDLDRYAASLPTRGTVDSVAVKAADRQRRKEEAEIRRTEASAKRQEFLLDVDMGKYILKDQVYLELAARAVTLSAGIRTAFESAALDILAAVDGNPKKALVLTEQLEKILDDALNDYSREMEFEVTFTPPESSTLDENHDDNPA